MSETRKIAAILVADMVGYSRLAGADEDRTLSRLRGLRSDLVDPAIDAHHGRVVKRTGDGILIEFRSVVDAVRCAIEVQNGMVERTAGVPAERRIEFRVGVHLGDVVEEADGDLMGDGVNIAARLESICAPGAICLSEQAYKGKPLEVKTIGLELNVRYVLEGSVQRGGNRMRVNVQLIDAETGSHLWAERFDKPLADLFDMQDEIVARLAGALNTELIAAEARRAEQAPNPDSTDLYFQGVAWFNKGITRDNVAQAQSFFDRALTADPGNIDALVGSAHTDVAAGAQSFVADPVAAFAAAEAKLTKALSSVPDHARGHMTLGYVYILTKRAAPGIAECEHALALDRNLAAAHSIIGFGKTFIGRAEETEAHIVEALRLSPRDTLAYRWMTVAGIAKNHAGLYDQAIPWFRRSIEANRNFPHPHFVLSVALALLGRLDEARSSVRAGLALNPSLTLSRARANWTSMSDDRTHLAQLECLLEGLRKAGLPEQ